MFVMVLVIYSIAMWEIFRLAESGHVVVSGPAKLSIILASVIALVLSWSAVEVARGVSP